MDFNEFKNEASNILNIKLSSYKIKRVKRRTNSLMRRHDVKDYDQCLHLLKNDPEFKAAYLNHFTINTSEFFRNPDTFKYLKNEILPKLLEKQNKVNIWSAPCSNGSEPYTISIILHELGVNKSRYNILASDLDKKIIKTAKNGQYGNSSLKNVSDDLINKYFEKLPGKNKYQLDKEIINDVKFEKKDLINGKFPKNWHIILSRNFFIYLTKEVKKQLTEKFISVLNEGGYFFLGNTEFLFNPGRYGLNKEFLSFYRKEN
ncbi:MAG: CheR family methyltransferase [Bacillota bacterium]